MLSWSHNVTVLEGLQQRLQISQGFPPDHGYCCFLHSTASGGIEHPLRHQVASIVVLFRTAAEYGLSTLNEGFKNPNRAAMPRVPRIADFSRFSTMGLELSSCTIAGRTHLVLGKDTL